MIYDVVIIGAGQAGLSMGFYLKQDKLSFIILDKANQIGEVWSNRYDSLTLFTPRSYSSLPGLSLSVSSNTYPSKDEIAEYLKTYVKTFSLPVQLNTMVEKLSKREDGFEILTNQGKLTAKKIVVATGPFQKSLIPKFAKNISEDIFQIHSSQYTNPSQLKEGSVLVVGGGNSGAQIAVEISGERKTYLSVSHKLKFLPQDIGNRSIFWYFDKLGIYNASVKSMIGQLVKKQPDPIFGFDLKSKIKSKSVILKPRTKTINNDTIFFEDGSEVKVNNVIWATGFKSDYSWIDIPNLLNDDGVPIHERGITSIEGLYFLGLAWQSSRGSALLQGVGKDANYLRQHMVKN